MRGLFAIARTGSRSSFSSRGTPSPPSNVRYEIAKASADFNIRQMGTVDNPMLALGFLQRVYRPRFRFTLRGRDAAAWAGRVDRRVPRNRTAHVDAQHGQQGRLCARPLLGRSRTGRVVRTEVVFSALGTESTVTTSFEMDERLGTSVPVEMRFKRGGTKNEVRGVATYGRFRQFEVGTEESLK